MITIKIKITRVVIIISTMNMIKIMKIQIITTTRKIIIIMDTIITDIEITISTKLLNKRNLFEI